MKATITAFLMIMIWSSGKAQISPAASKGFWVIESNINEKKTQLVKFYDSDHRLIYEEKIEGKRIRYEKPRTQKKLNEVLQAVLETKDTLHSKSLLAKHFKSPV